MTANLDSVLVIDADGHVNEGDVDLKPYLPEKWRAQAPVRLRDNKGHPRMLLEGRIWPAAEGPGPGVSGPMTEKARKTPPGMTDPAARFKDMDLEGIDVAVLFGTQIALTANGLMNGELAAALCRAVNEWLIEYCGADRKRLLAVGLIPCQAPEAAVKELEFLAKAGAVSAMLPTNVYGRNMGDPMFFPIYDAAEKIGMTLSVHPQTGHDGVPGVSGVMGAGSRRFYKYAYVHMTAFPFELMIAMMHMIGEGVFDRFPRLRVAYMEGGAGWLPYWMERFDEHLEKLAPQMPALKRRPSEIIRSEQIVLSCESEESGLDRVLEAAGAGSVLYASDYCHWDCHFPYSAKDIVDARDLNDEQREIILSRNAIDFFKLKNLPQPRALKIARQSWEQEARKAAVGK
jgi:predicted TIM-barrel fold metal-dependent hydrolase